MATQTSIKENKGNYKLNRQVCAQFKMNHKFMRILFYIWCIYYRKNCFYQHLTQHANGQDHILPNNVVF